MDIADGDLDRRDCNICLTCFCPRTRHAYPAKKSATHLGHHYPIFGSFDNARRKLLGYRVSSAANRRVRGLPSDTMPALTALGGADHGCYAAPARRQTRMAAVAVQVDPRRVECPAAFNRSATAWKVRPSVRSCRIVG